MTIRLELRLLASAPPISLTELESHLRHGFDDATRRHTDFAVVLRPGLAAEIQPYLAQCADGTFDQTTAVRLHVLADLEEAGDATLVGTLAFDLARRFQLAVRDVRDQPVTLEIVEAVAREALDRGVKESSKLARRGLVTAPIGLGLVTLGIMGAFHGHVSIAAIVGGLLLLIDSVESVVDFVGVLLDRLRRRRRSPR